MNLDRLLREHYRSKNLRPAAMEEIMTATPAQIRRWATVRRMLLPAVAALVAVGALLPFVGRSGLEPSIRREVATNHLKLLAPEFVESDLRRLRLAMDDLDFRLVESAAIRDRDLRLVGARYCSIQGRLAAQLQLEDGRGQNWTLYQAPLDGSLAEVKAGIEEVDGVSVELWKERGMLLALASDEA